MSSITPQMMELARQAILANQGGVPPAAAPVPRYNLAPQSPQQLALDAKLGQTAPPPFVVPSAPPSGPPAAQPQPQAGSVSASVTAPLDPQDAIAVEQSAVATGERGLAEVKRIKQEGDATRNDAAALKLDAGIAASKVDEKKAGIEADMLEHQFQIARDQHKQMVDAAAVASRQAHEQIAKMTQAIDLAAQTHINSWWESAGTGGRMLGILSMALNGKGGTDAIMGLIANELDTQKANLGVRQQEVENRKSLLSEMKKVTDDDAAAQNAAAQVAISATMKQAEALAKRLAASGHPEAIANAKKLVADLAGTQQELKSKADASYLQSYLSADAHLIEAKHNLATTLDTAIKTSLAGKGKVSALVQQQKSDISEAQNALDEIQQDMAAGRRPAQGTVNRYAEAMFKVENAGSKRPMTAANIAPYKQRVGIGSSVFDLVSTKARGFQDPDSLLREKERLKRLSDQLDSGAVLPIPGGSGGGGDSSGEME